MEIAVSYTIFALIATAANIGSQEISVQIYSGLYSVTLSVLVGTIVGLVVKYLLDKKYIFRFTPKNRIHEGQTFVLYTLTGVLTTAIFWGMEFGFHYAFDSKTLRYVGGILGLAIGYILKYQFDKRFVFGARP